MYELSDLQISVLNNLHTKILNKSFNKLITNDYSIIPENNYIPNIWECKWYNSEAIPGYSKGHCVWRNSISSLNDFLSAYGDQVYAYTQENPRLDTYLSAKWSELISADLDEKVLSVQRDRYYNVISGYAIWDTDKSGRIINRKQIYNRLFDFGDATPKKNIPPNTPLEIFISLQDNNKSEVQDSNYWKNIVLSDQASYDNYIESEIKILFDEHIKNYHFSNLLTSEAEVDKFLVRNSLSNFNIDEVQTTKVQSHENYINSEGLDFIKDFGKTEFPVEINGQNYKLYKWFRLWNSGYLEHGGIVPILPVGGTITSKDYSVKVNLDWQYICQDKGKSTIKTSEVYNYPESSSPFYGSVTSKLYYGKTGNQSVYEEYDQLEKKLNPNCRYSICVSPVSFDPTNDFNSSGKLQDFSILSSNGSGYGYPLNNYMSSYVVIELHHIQNNSFEITKNNTDDISKAGKINFYQYYTSGFRAKEIEDNSFICLTTTDGKENLFGSLKTGIIIQYRSNDQIHSTNYPYSLNEKTAYPANIHSLSVGNESISCIGEQSFFECLNMISANLYQTKEIKKKAFYGCEALEEIVAPQVEKIEDLAFSKCRSLRLVDLTQLVNPPSLESYTAFSECNDSYVISVGNLTYDKFLADTQWNYLSDHISK